MAHATNPDILISCLSNIRWLGKMRAVPEYECDVSLLTTSSTVLGSMSLGNTSEFARLV